MFDDSAAVHILAVTGTLDNGEDEAAAFEEELDSFLKSLPSPHVGLDEKDHEMLDMIERRLAA